MEKEVADGRWRKKLEESREGGRKKVEMRA